MIHSSRQLKALVRNRSGGDSAKAQIIIRNYIMERFLERLSLSPYRNNLILKGGTLVSAMVGLDMRSTMDIDATIRAHPLSEESAWRIVNEIASISIDDGISFNMKSVTSIMEEGNYPGIRVALDAILETMLTPLKIDFSAGDVITPKEIEYSFRLMFEDRTISILAYNLETILAEKLETLLSRSTANTRMRDFYDIHILALSQSHNIMPSILREAFFNTSKSRGSLITDDADILLVEIESSPELIGLWERYRKKFDYAADINWPDIMKSVKQLCAIVLQ